MGESESYVSSSHTVAELKVMCKENGLSATGRKSELIERLNRYFMGDDEPEEVISLEEEEVISLEDEESISMEESNSVPLPKIDDDEDEILEAEVIDAEVIEETAPAFIKESSSSATLMDQLKNPKVAAILLTILLATGGWYWYVSCLLYTSPSPRDGLLSRMPSSA